MMQPEITALLRKWSDGEPAAADELTPLLYAELRRLAHRLLLQERPNHTLHSAELVHEAFLRMIDQTQARWQDRAHFYKASAQIMRHILVDHARARLRQKRGAGATMLVINEAIDIPEQRSFDVVALDDALEGLAKLDPQQSRIVELRFFAGFSIDETAQALGISPRTVERDWVTARAWLLREISRR
jgi:RNA polymerase sigma factor (TIGR02999 family)